MVLAEPTQGAVVTGLRRDWGTAEAWAQTATHHFSNYKSTTNRRVCAINFHELTGIKQVQGWDLTSVGR
jgi:hypothetical protein